MAIVLLTGSMLLIISLVMIYITRRKRAVALQRLLVCFSRLGTAYHLAFTSQEILSQRIIGLDGLKRTLLVLEFKENSYHWYTIYLDDVISCRVEKMYKPVSIGLSRRRSCESHLNKIAIVFEKKGGQRNVIIPFYEYGKNSVIEVTLLARKASYWECILTKMLTVQVKPPAKNGIRSN